MKSILLSMDYPNIYNDHIAIFIEDQARALAKHEEGMKHIYETVYGRREIRKHIIKNFSEKVVTERLINIYKMVLHEA